MPSPRSYTAEGAVLESISDLHKTGRDQAIPTPAIREEMLSCATQAYTGLAPRAVSTRDTQCVQSTFWMAVSAATRCVQRALKALPKTPKASAPPPVVSDYERQMLDTKVANAKQWEWIDREPDDREPRTSLNTRS